MNKNVKPLLVANFAVLYFPYGNMQFYICSFSNIDNFFPDMSLVIPR
jgi:hypothetical protein